MKPTELDCLVSQRKLTCIHFTGLQHKACEAGVDYSSMRDVSAPGIAHWPCLPGKRACATVCPKRKLHTEASARAFVARMDDAIESAFGRIDAGQCPECGKPIEPSETVGHCKYGACGHRIGQALTEGDQE